MSAESSWHRRYRNEFGSLDRVVFAVKKYVPPTFSLTHWFLQRFGTLFSVISCEFVSLKSAIFVMKLYWFPVDDAAALLSVVVLSKKDPREGDARSICSLTHEAHDDAEWGPTNPTLWFSLTSLYLYVFAPGACRRSHILSEWAITLRLYRSSGWLPLLYSKKKIWHILSSKELVTFNFLVEVCEISVVHNLRF